MPDLRADAFDVLTFDCYGTLVDWESAIIEYLQSVLLAHDVHVFDGTILEFYAAWEPLEQNAGGSYRDVLARVMQRYGSRLGFTPNDDETAGFINAITASSAFPDTNDAIQQFATKFELGVISNTDTDLIESTLSTLPTSFTHVVTAQQLGVYKPNPKAMKTAFEQISGGGTKRILHVAQSRFHYNAPATDLGIATVWINRENEHGSAAQHIDATPTWEFKDLEQLANALELSN